MKRHGTVVLFVSLFGAVLLSSCTGVQGTSAETSSVSSASASSIEAASDDTDETVHKETSNTAEEILYEKLDVLSGYHIEMTIKPLAGPAAGSLHRYDAVHLPFEKAYSCIRYMAPKGEDYMIAEEMIVIGDSKWVKPYGKEWTTGAGTNTVYLTELVQIYKALDNGNVTKLGNETVGGLNTLHYSFVWETGSTHISGEIWVIDEETDNNVIIKAFGKQGMLDKDKKIREDSSYLEFSFEIDQIDSELQIKSPI